MDSMPIQKRRLVVLLSTNANGDKSTVAFSIAHAALSAGMEVLVFLVSDGVELSRDGASDRANFQPFAPLSSLIESFVANGGALAACGSCFQYHGLKPDQILPKAQLAGVATLATWLAAGAATVSL